MNINEKNISYQKKIIQSNLEKYIEGYTKYISSLDDNSLTSYDKIKIEEDRDYLRHQLFISINELSSFIYESHKNKIIGESKWVNLIKQ